MAAKLVFGMNQSLDGYVDLTGAPPSPELFRHFVAEAQAQVGSIYGRKMYETMRYWDDDQPDWDEAEREFAAAWRGTPKWVVSRSLSSVGPNATLISGDIEAAVRGLKDELAGEVEVGLNLLVFAEHLLQLIAGLFTHLMFEIAHLVRQCVQLGKRELGLIHHAV